MYEREDVLQMKDCSFILFILSLSLSLPVQFEDAARDAADELTQPRPEGEEHVEDIQVLLKSDANPIQIRDLRVCCIM